MTFRTTLQKKGKRRAVAHGETVYTDRNGRRMVARYCDHCDGMMRDCPKCHGIGIVTERQNHV